MKRIVFIVLASLFILPAMAQEEEQKPEIQYLFKNADIHFTGAYMAPEIKFSQVNGENGVLVGGHLATNFNRKLSMGIAGYGLATRNEFDVAADSTLRVGFGYGGMFTEYVLFSDKAVHVTIPVIIGVGGVTVWDSDEDLYQDEEWNDIESSAAFVLEPGINLEVNLTKFMRFSAGASYRLVQKSDLRNLSDEDLSNFSVNVGLRFGFYR